LFTAGSGLNGLKFEAKGNTAPATAMVDMNSLLFCIMIGYVKFFEQYKIIFY
jgi:hypothetical protein